MGNLNESVQLIYRSLKRFISLSFVVLFMILTVRLYEIIIIYNISNYPPGTFLSLLIGIKYDLILYLRFSAFLLIPFLILAYFSIRTARFFFIFLSILLILCDMLLLHYFRTTRVPLGADLFGYTFDEMMIAAGASGNLNVAPFIMILLYIAIMIRVFKKHVYYKLKAWVIWIGILLMICSVLLQKQLAQKPSNYDNEFSMFVAGNKADFFIKSISNKYILNRAVNEEYIFEENASANENNLYIDPEYPFLRKETTPDILGEYFELKETPPNIVFILVESLGRAYSGEGAYLGSFTPFLDSLTQHSLYWENCLSTSGRTFEVLPSVLASVPFGDKGFADLGDNMPNHLSIMGLLKRQAGYNLSFYYGGKADFDNMDIFLRRQGIDKITDSREDWEGYSKLPGTNNGFTWGYGDKEIFRKYMEDLDPDMENSRLDVILTLAMHDPFNIPDQEYYNSQYSKRLDKLQLSEKTMLFNNHYVKQFASILYFDDALQYYFQEMSQKPSFENTIFIITGDHRMPEIPISTQLDRFHVPLIIYSPLIKKSEKFSSIVTHFDITPSFVALFDKADYISRPEIASWIGYGLDNSKKFRNLNSYPLMRNKNELLDFVNGENFIANNLLYKINNNMDIEIQNDPELQKQILNEFDNFISKNNYVSRNNKLIPDSLLKWTFPDQ